MNSWLKYGGIIPELINLNILNWVYGYNIINDGTISPWESGSYTENGIILTPGRYKIRYYCTKSDMAYVRIHAYDNGVWKRRIDGFQYFSTEENKIYELTFTIEQIEEIRLSNDVWFKPFSLEKIT